MKFDKIIFIHLLNDYSGSPKVLSQVISVVRHNGCEIDLYTGKALAHHDEGFLSNLTPNHYFYFYTFFVNKYLTLLSFMLSQFILFFKLLRYWNKDVSFYINTMLPFGAALAAKLMGKPVTYHIHEMSLKPAIFKRFLRFFIQLSANKLIFVSKAVEQAEHFEKKEQVVIHNALESAFLEQACKHDYCYLIKQKFNVLMICSLKAYKGVNEFIEVASLCSASKNIRFKLLLNANQKDMDVFFKERALPENLTLVTQQKNVIPFYQQSSLLVNLSRVDEWVETFGLTILEAMAFGIPVIVPPVGGPTEIVRDGVEGYLISSYDVKKIANTILGLSKDEKVSMLLSNAARKRVNHFKEDIFEEKLFGLVNE